MWGDFLTEGCCNGAETPWPGGLSDYTRISSFCLEELELPQKADVLVMVSLLQSVRDVPRALQAPRATPTTTL